MYNSVFENPMKNVRKHKHIKFVTTEERRNYLVSELNHHTIFFFFSKNILAIKMKRTQILMNKTVYLGLSMLEMSKTVMYEFWYDYVKPKYGEKVRLCYMATHCKRCWY